MTVNEPILQKADFGDIYTQPDPRMYFNTLSALDYRIPQEGADLFKKLLTACGRDQHRVPTIIDVCCSYGIVSTLLKTDIDISEITNHYAHPAVAELTTDQVRKVDTELLAKRFREPKPRVIGLDISKNAVEYALAVDSLDFGFVEDLEHNEPSAGLVEAMASVDLITCTGGVGYVSEHTFGRLVQAAPPTAYVAVLCLRTYDYAPIAEALAQRGLVTESPPNTYRQRRFADADEQAWAFERVRKLGFDPEGVETDGYYHANFFLSRPAVEVEAKPLAALFA